ncbi:MAG: hypothetical protein AAF939_17165, partial [Planctomycetota bacterium]
GIVGVNFHVTRLVTRFLKEFVRYRVSIRHGFELSKKLVMPSTPILTRWAVDNSLRNEGFLWTDSETPGLAPPR